jgi:hypothetical protein
MVDQSGMTAEKFEKLETRLERGTINFKEIRPELLLLRSGLHLMWHFIPHFSPAESHSFQRLLACTSYRTNCAIKARTQLPAIFKAKSLSSKRISMENEQLSKLPI